MVRNAKILLLCKKNVFKCTTLKEYDHAFFVLEMIFRLMIFSFISGVHSVYVLKTALIVAFPTQQKSLINEPSVFYRLHVLGTGR